MELRLEDLAGNGSMERNSASAEEPGDHPSFFRHCRSIAELSGFLQELRTDAVRRNNLVSFIFGFMPSHKDNKVSNIFSSRCRLAVSIICLYRIFFVLLVHTTYTPKR